MIVIDAQSGDPVEALRFDNTTFPSGLLYAVTNDGTEVKTGTIFGRMAVIEITPGTMRRCACGSELRQPESVETGRCAVCRQMSG